MTRAIHPIEAESYRILRSRIDLSHLPPLSRAVAERIIHAAADVAFGATLVLDEAALERGRAALLAGAPIYCDARMAAAGITTREPIVPSAPPVGEHDAVGRGDARARSPARPRARCGSSATRRPRSRSSSPARPRNRR